MTFTDGLTQPKAVQLKNTTIQKLLVHGQGVFIFHNQNGLTPCDFYIYNNKMDDGYYVLFEEGSIKVTSIKGCKTLIDTENQNGLLEKNGIYYWFSIDSQNRCFYAGFGEPRMENIEYFYQLPENSRNFLESLTQIVVCENNDLVPLKLLRDPITQNIPLKVKDSNKLTMEDVAKNSYMPVANMTTVCQKLYNCISGENFVLDSPDFPHFSDAIEYSINTPGCWCYQKLREKATEFNPTKPNLNETYLRITLGQNNGESPGIPYVMEIWPVGHYSPVHNHSSANAIIRVFHGSINVSLYPFLCDSMDGIQPFGNADFNEGDITWISANYNQVHQLKNLEINSKACITIQCYMYDENDKVHYDYFDYLDDDYKKEQYNPDSDCEFMEFKSIIQSEWKKYNTFLKNKKRKLN